MPSERYLIDGADATLDPESPEATAALSALAAALLSSSLGSRLAVEQLEEALVVELRGATRGELLALLQSLAAELRVHTEAELLAAVSPLFEPLASAAAPALPSSVELDEAKVLGARAALLKLGALWHSDLRLLELLRRLAKDPRPQVRAGVLTVANRVGYQLFLLELLASETNPPLKRILKSVTAFPQLENP